MISRRTMLSLGAVAALPGVAQAQSMRCSKPTPPDPVVLARAELLATFLESGSLDEALKYHAAAALTPEQVQALRAIPVAELAAVRAFQSRLDKLALPQLVLRRETLRRSFTTGECKCEHTPPTNQAPK